MNAQVPPAALMNQAAPAPTTTTEPAAWIGWDWADQNHDIYLETADGKSESLRLPNRPKELHAWLQALGERFGRRPVVLCMEACRSSLLPILTAYPFLELYRVNPKSMARFREVIRPGGAKSDQLDCRLACQLVRSHRSLLCAHVTEDPLTIELAQLVSHRRMLVDQRSALANQLKEVLKFYYPLALELLEDDTTTALAADFVLKFPTLRAVQETPLAQVRKFFLGEGCRLTEGLQERLARIAGAVAVSREACWVNPNSQLACALAAQVRVLVDRIKAMEEYIATLGRQHPNHELAESLPGAAKVLEPRLMAVLGTRVDACPTAAALAVRDGVAPRRVQSGNTEHISRRVAKPQFEHQTWIEFAKCSMLECGWAREFVAAKIKAGKGYFTAIRALAYKWMRILHACWRSGTPYDEAVYLAALKKAGSPYASPAVSTPE